MPVRGRFAVLTWLKQAFWALGSAFLARRSHLLHGLERRRLSVQSGIRQKQGCKGPWTRQEFWHVNTKLDLSKTSEISTLNTTITTHFLLYMKLNRRGVLGFWGFGVLGFWATYSDQKVKFKST